MASESHYSILIIDDDVRVAEAFAAALGRGGYQTRVANNAEDGLWDAEQDVPDAIIVDYRMPMINGAGFLYRLRKSPHLARVPVVVITGDTSLADDVRDELQQLGATIRQKPIQVDELLGAVRALVAGDDN